MIKGQKSKNEKRSHQITSLLQNNIILINTVVVDYCSRVESVHDPNVTASTQEYLVLVYPSTLVCMTIKLVPYYISTSSATNCSTLWGMLCIHGVLATRFNLGMEMSRLTRDGTAETVPRDQTLRRERGQGNINFLCSTDHEHD